MTIDDRKPEYITFTSLFFFSYECYTVINGNFTRILFKLLKPFKMVGNIVIRTNNFQEK